MHRPEGLDRVKQLFGGLRVLASDPFAVILPVKGREVHVLERQPAREVRADFGPRLPTPSPGIVRLADQDFDGVCGVAWLVTDLVAPCCVIVRVDPRRERRLGLGLLQVWLTP